MYGNLLTLAKWLPTSIVEHEGTFGQCRELRVRCVVLILDLVKVAETLKDSRQQQFVNSSDFLIEDVGKIVISVEEMTGKFSKCFQDIQMGNVHALLTQKCKVFKQLLQKTKLQLCYILQEFISDVFHLFVFYKGDLLTLSLRLSTAYNDLLVMDAKYKVVKNSNSVCNNTCPYVLFPLRKFSVTRFLQILSYRRAESCCHKLIDCLLDSYKTHDNDDDDNSSDNSSVEIYMALTNHLSLPFKIHSQNLKSEEDSSNVIDVGTASFVNLDELISTEERCVLNLLNSMRRVAPTMLEKEGIRKKNGDIAISKRTIKKILEYYEQTLWAEVGNYLEHVILWWARSALSARPPRSSQHLREWINNFIPTAEVPTVILSALTSLADALGVHVTLTSWDQCFRQALVASKSACNIETGKLFCNVLQELVLLSNLCEVTPDWIVGAPLDELPLVEQIPVLHRLDHSIHTTRHWTMTESKKIANHWNVQAFFTITHTDIVNCLGQLTNLRLTDHVVEIEKGGMAVHVEVCTLMRAKLVSEVKDNIQKLKDTPSECVSCLASICKVINLANLQMIFPPETRWKIKKEDVPSCANAYVEKYLGKMLSPVLVSIDDDSICNMILTLICESWLDHIYSKKIKFSQWGAFQLLCDFAYVSVWIQECTFISERMQKQLLKNEVLRRCEGVGKLLLRCPGERLKMIDRKVAKNADESDDDTQHQQMPAEMYVPNQEQWLELRALKRTSKLNTFCCGNVSQLS